MTVLEATATVLSATLVLSGLMKIFSPGDLIKLMPNLPSWFWLPAGIWEVVVGILLIVGGQYAPYGLILAFTFLGGVLYSTTVLKDSDGNTLVSGKSSLGSGGHGMPVPGLFYTTVYVLTGLATMTPTAMLTSYAAGFISGFAFESAGTADAVYLRALDKII